MCPRLHRLFLALAIASIPWAAQANLVANGGFENAGAEPWHLPDWARTTPADEPPLRTSDYTHGGSYGAMFIGDTAMRLSQTLATTAGQTYAYSFWIKNLVRPESDPAGLFLASAGGIALMPPLPAPPGPLDGPFVQYQGSFVASAAATELVFQTSGMVFNVLDDVSVVQQVPEPAGVALLGIGLLGLAATRRRA